MCWSMEQNLDEVYSECPSDAGKNVSNELSVRENDIESTSSKDREWMRHGAEQT